MVTNDLTPAEIHALLTALDAAGQDRDRQGAPSIYELDLRSARAKLEAAGRTREIPR